MVAEAYWRGVLETGMRVPTDRPLDELTAELVSLLGHRDPRRRIDYALAVLREWIATGVYDDLLLGLGDGIVVGLEADLGADGDLSVLRRSFSALVLGRVIERDNRVRALERDTLFRWGDQATSWYLRERDLRGWVPGCGWAHAAASGAELLGSLARSSHLGRLELTVVLDVVADRLLAPTTYAWQHREDDRLAYAVMAILHRDLVPAEVLEPWLNRLGGRIRPGPDPGAEWPTPPAANTTGFLRSLYLQLALGVRGRDDVATDAALFAEAPSRRADLLLAILDQLRGATPDLFSPARVPAYAGSSS